MFILFFLSKLDAQTVTYLRSGNLRGNQIVFSKNCNLRFVNQTKSNYENEKITFIRFCIVEFWS
jgi:hypothetical protein